MENKTGFRSFISQAFDQGEYATDDVIAFVLPLFREVLGFHEEGRVAAFEDDTALFVQEGRLDIDEQLAHDPKNAKARLQGLLDKHRSHYFEITDHLRLDTDVNEGIHQIQNLQIHLDHSKPLNAPAYLRGYRCFEMELGHHDDQTDIFCLGLILGSMALGLDLYDEEDLKTFVGYRSTPLLYNQRLHPTIGQLITEMTELDRQKRSQDLYDIIHRLENYREFDPEKQIDLSQVAGWKTKEISNKGQFILGKLRNRLFDTSRRNRLLYYKPNMRFVNLTVSSVPMVLHYQSIRPELLFTWNSEIAGKVKEMKEIVLNKYLRFEDHAYLAASLDKIRVEAQHDIQEYGFSQLKLVIAFLNWHNLREDLNERIQSPLLLIPVELRKNKKLKEDHYVMKVLANEAEVNPILANQLRELYGIRLPDFIDLDDTTPEAFYEKLREQIDHANQGISLQLIGRPRIKLIHSVARQTVNNYKKRLRRTGGLDSYKNIAYSYQRENFKPLGLEIFRQRIEPRPSMLEFLVNDDIHLATNQLTGSGERQLYQLAESENNPYSWDFDLCHIVLGNFNYKKMSLVRDYNQVIDSQLHHPVFEMLFSDQPKKYQEEENGADDPGGWYHVIAADPTQTRAVLRARAGESYIIQGPPGTGKSQTITNLIADFVARDKHILFVCEKRAALDVVYHRLKQQGLDELCCYIHDSQGDKREFIRNLKETYEDFIRNQPDLKKIREEREILLRKIGQQLELLRNYHFTNARPSDPAGLRLFELIERLIELKPHIASISQKEEELLPHYSEWNAFGETIKKLGALLEETGAEPYFAGHPYSQLREEIFLSPAPFTMLLDAVNQAKTLLDEMVTIRESFGLRDWDRFDQWRALMEDAALLHPLAETGNTTLVDKHSEQARLFDQEWETFQELQNNYKQTLDRNCNWRNKFSEQDLATAIPLAKTHERSFFGFFNSAWRRLKKTLNGAYDFSAHQVRPAYSQVLQNLQEEYQLAHEILQRRKELSQQFGNTDPEIIRHAVDKMRAKRGDAELDFLLQHPQAATLIKSLYSSHASFWQLEACLRGLLHNHDRKTMSEMLDDLENIMANQELLRELLPVLRELAQTSPPMRKMIRELPLHPLGFEATMAHKTLRYVYQHKKEFEHCDGILIETAVSQLHQHFRQLLKLNAAYIRAKKRTAFLSHLEISNRALSQLSPTEKVFKKNYTEGRKILENEFGKSMRYKSIRELAARESGLVLKDLKPVWLMSPLSVSDTLPVDTGYFDVVIFDEASQITLEEGIPSLYRAPQTIIVGDEKQMPPTNFFSAKPEDPDDLEKTDEEAADEALSHDADSLLVQGSRKLNSVMLGWHYRSRYETLISYSNHAFYEAGLLTIPDRTIHHNEKSTIEVSSATQAAAFAGALFDRSISFHFLTNSVYEKRSNAAEAAYIAELVREVLKTKAQESIGIVAFSQEQQQTIEEALSALAAGDPEFEQLLEEAYQRTEDDQYLGLIVKNLENIQGDERDIIIMSVCYGPDARKKMLMNFGPINKRGGEKRLNVLFSRAKKHMAVISSIRHHQITNEYNEGANYFKRFLHYAELVSTGQMHMARTVLDSLVLRKEGRREQKSRTALRQIREALEKKGYLVDEYIGQSDFKCSLGVRLKQEDEAYTLSILIDDEAHYSNENLLEQYYQRPAILRDFGWRTIAVFMKDWFHHPQAVLERIIRRLHEDIREQPSNSMDLENLLRPGIETNGQQAGLNENAGSGLYQGLKFERFVYTGGNSNKFWEVALDGSRLVIRFGRTGTKGQVQVKTFGTSEKAEEERKKLVNEKTAKGYRLRDQG